MAKTIALIGAGSHGSSLHGRAYQHLMESGRSDFEICGVCDLDTERAKSLAGRLNCQSVWSDYMSMVDRLRPDAVVAVTPIGLTGEMVSRLLEFKIPLVIEKPPGANYEQAARLADLVSGSAIDHMVSFNRRFAPPTRWFMSLRERLPSGGPQMLVARMSRVNRTENDFVYGTGLHLVDVARCLLGDPAGEVVSAGRAGVENGSAGYAEVDFDRVRGLFVFAPDSGCEGESIELTYRQHTVKLDYQRGTGSFRQDGKILDQFALAEDSPRYIRDGNLAEAEFLIDFLGGKLPWRPHICDVLESVRITQSMQDAM